MFQFESDGIRDLLKRLKPDNFGDIIACTALYRPGPLNGGMVDAYVNCKHGREKPIYHHPVMEEILGQTYGVMVYQEQIMRILNKLGGIELSSAYACIKAISKKKQEIIDQRRKDFLRGAAERGVAQKTAEDIFALIVFFGGYGFNASHSASGALVSYQTAYLKAHYTPEFMAALLSSRKWKMRNKGDIMAKHCADAAFCRCRSAAADHVNSSESMFSTSHDSQDRLPALRALKGFGRGSAGKKLCGRAESGPFKRSLRFL